MNKWFLILYYILILGGNIIAYIFQFDLSALWLAGVLILLYIYFLPDIFKKKKMDKERMSVKALIIYALPFLINCISVLLFH